MRGIAIVVTLVAALVALPGTALAKDGDSDRLPDRWEKKNGLSTTKASARGDVDGDGLTNLQEFRCHTKARVADSDGDNREDGDEDPDRDNVDNGNEMDEGTRPFDRDSDDDGTRDGREDPDRDKLVNSGEDDTGNDPKDPDTDDDGVKDGKERAGTIASFTGGVLTIDLANGDSVKGLVNDKTEIECETEDEHEDSDDSADSKSRHFRDAIAAPGDDDEGGPSKEDDVDEEDGDNNDVDDGDQNDGEHEDGENSEHDGDSCGQNELQQGVAVHEAELKVSAGGLVFTDIELIK